MRKLSVLCVVSVLVACRLPAGAATWTADFTQGDGAPEGWFVVHPDATVAGEALSLAPTTAAEPHAFAGVGGNAIWLAEVSRIEFDLTYPGSPPDWPNDHGGVLFCMQNTNERWGNYGYVIDFLVDGFRCMKVAATAQPEIAHAAGITAPEGRWTIEFTETGFRFLLNDIEQLVATDTQYRSGYLGFWCYTNVGQEMAIDNLRVDFTPTPCPVLTPAQVVSTVAAGNALATVGVPFDARTTPYEVTLRSSNPAVAAPLGHTGGALALSFPPDGPFAQAVEVGIFDEGTADLTVQVAGSDCSSVKSKVEVWNSVTYTEDFAQADGPPEDWVVVHGDAFVTGEALALTAIGAGEPHAYAGAEGSGIWFDHPYAIECDLSFPGTPGDWPPDHGGILFCMQNTNDRWGNTGYCVDWLDGRFRCILSVAGVQTEIATTPAAVYEGTWTIRFTPTGFVFALDGVDQMTIAHTDYRSGYVGFWCYTNGGQQIAADNLSVQFATSPCPSITPAAAEALAGELRSFTVRAPFGANLDGMYKAKVVTSDASIAVPVGAVGGELALTFPATIGQAEATFDVDCVAGGAAELTVVPEGASCPGSASIVTVLALNSFADTFAQADGAPEKWTPLWGDWQVAGEQLTVDSAGSATEVWIFAGAPAAALNAYTLSFDITLTNPNAGDAVGRHGGIILCAREPLDRYQTGGYTLDWIDRMEDRGYRASRFDEVPGGRSVQVGLAPNTGTVFELGTHWEIFVSSTSLALAVDGIPIGEVADQTYRGGYFGFWAFNNGTQVAIDNVVIGESSSRPPTASFTAAPLTGGAPLDVSFDASGSTDNGTITSYAWEFGDTANGSGVTTTHTYTAAGVYTVKLTVTDNDGLTGTASRTITVTQGGTTFRRGDTNADGRTNIADAICLLGYLFGPSTDPCKVSVPRCRDGADANNDGNLNIADAIMVLGYLFNFAKTGNLPEPFLACGTDPADPPDSLDCTTYAPCAR